MRVRYLLLCSTTLLKIYHVHGHCIDIHSRIVSQGLHYVPGGSNPCTLCICDKGGPKWCKSVLCSPPQNCKSFQVGSSCCEFKCLDDILSTHDNYKDTYDVALRFIATTVTAVLSISLLFFLYNRLKRNKSLQHHNHQHEEQRNLNNVGFIAGNFGYNQHSMGYLGSGNNDIEIRYEETNTNFSLWKPPGNYFPPGEAPPPYEEAMRGVQNDLSHNATTHNTLINSITSAYPQEIAPAFIQCRHDNLPANSSAQQAQQHPQQAIPNTSNAEIPNISSNAHQYVNVRVQVQHNDHKKYERPHHNHYPGALQIQQQQLHLQHKAEVSYENIAALKGCALDRHDRQAVRPTSSGLNKSVYHKSRSTGRSHIGTGTNATSAAEAPKILASSCGSSAPRTAPPSSILTATLSAISASAASSSTMTDAYELVPHTPHLLGAAPSHLQAQAQSTTASPSAGNAHANGRYTNDAHHNISKLKHGSDAVTTCNARVQLDPKKSLHRTLPKNLRELLSSPDGFKIGSALCGHQLQQAERALVSDAPKVTFASTPKLEKLHVPQPPVMMQSITAPVIETPKPVMSVHDKLKNVPHKNLLAYQSLSQDEEDYRSECENCKTANVSCADDDGEAMNETMSLQRHPLSESGYELSYRTSLSLPTHSRKQRTHPCTTNIREKWFTPMQQTSSEESD